MVELAFVVSRDQNWFFLELVETLRQELDSLGVTASLSDDGFPPPAPDRVYVLVPPHEYVALEGDEALGDDPALLARTIFICAEQPGSVHFDDNVALSRQAGAVFDINGSSVSAFRRQGILAEHLALGYSPRWDRYDPGRTRDIDILFMGCRSERRTRYLASYARLLSRRHCWLQISDNSTPNTSGSATFLAEEKWDLIARSKLLINLHQADEPYFEWMRALDAIHCGAVFLSEHSSGHAPLQTGRHFFTGSPASLGLLADGLLSDEQRLRSVADAAYRLIRDRRPLSRAAESLRAAASRLAQGPMPAGVPTRPRNRPTIGRLTAPPPVTTDPDASMIRRALKDTRLDFMELRRDLARVRRALASPELRVPPRVRTVGWTSAWTATRGARISVLTALYNHAGEIGQALDSLARSRYPDFEVIVVDDGSTDGSGDAVQRWMRSHDDVALMHVEHPVNRGLGAARNTALDFARGQYCFVLDSDNVVYPRCLEMLTAHLDARPDAAFVYPIMDVFGHADAWVKADGDYLASVYGWDPDRLRIRNYIDALAMIRTSVLRDLGGYATDRRLHGLEDADLWCRIADRGWTGVHVPAILARYRASPSSMLSLTGLSLTSAYAALIERSPRLMAGIVPPD